MIIAGELKLKKPGLKHESIMFVHKRELIEFETVLDHARKQELEFDLEFNLNDSKTLTIKNDLAREDIITDSIFIDFISSDKRSVGLVFSINQAQALKEMLAHYIDAFYSFHAATSEKIIKTR
ncbi:hypothetical protein ES703_74842 [subsurface metagenome]